MLPLTQAFGAEQYAAAKSARSRGDGRASRDDGRVIATRRSAGDYDARIHLLFDLDGTLTDPFEGIARCYQHTLERMGRPIPPARAFARFIGPPLRSAFAELLADSPGEVERAIAIFRERFTDVGLFENEVYPGIPEALAALAEAGHTLFVATSKPQPFADRILEHFDLAKRFRAVQGAELGGRLDDKRLLVRELVEREGLPSVEAAMIGDREHDVRAGKASGLRTVGVLWGYGSRSELVAAGADLLAAAPVELGRLVLPAHRVQRSAGW